ncbi:Wadjet anti-phage system protein JetD domain-containing protein [Arthrobacter sp. D1-17]
MPADVPKKWTTLADLRALSLKSWSSGALLRELLEPTGVYPRRRSLKRPTANELLSDYAAARSWAIELSGGAGHYRLETVEVGRNTIGSNRLPAAAVFDTAEDEIAFAGKTKDSQRFRALAAGLSGLDASAGAPLRGWALKRPLQLLELGEAALTAARVALWLRENPSPGIYLRQLSLPGVHTKFIEAHRRVIDEMVALLRAGSADPQVDSADGGTAAEEAADIVDVALADPAGRTPAARFAARHGFLHPPELVRFRLLDPAIGALGAARDITVTAEAFSTLQLPVHTVIATENQVNFLALPGRTGTLALYGAGYGFTSLRDAAWLRDCEVLYWGDIDTHGFRILDQLRAVHPHVESVLMDEETLLEHRDAWGQEPSPSRAALTRLVPQERKLYERLGNDTFGSAVRLEQELIRWDWALARLGGLDRPGSAG